MRVDTHHSPDRDLARAVLYGIYDVVPNRGWGNVATDHDTVAFAVESIRRWYNGVGRASYPTAGQLLITADAGRLPYAPIDAAHALAWRTLRLPRRAYAFRRAFGSGAWGLSEVLTLA